MNNACHLISVAVILNIATACLAFVIIEVHVSKWDGWEVFVVGIEPASTGGVGPLATTRTAHVVDDSIHINVDLLALSVKKLDMSLSGEQYLAFEVSASDRIFTLKSGCILKERTARMELTPALLHLVIMSLSSFSLPDLEHRL